MTSTKTITTIKAYGDQEVKVIGSSLIHVYE